MKTNYELKLNKMKKDYDRINRNFAWSGKTIKHLLALTYTMKDKELDIDEINKTKKYIQTKTNMLSTFRGRLLSAFSGLLSANSDNPEEEFDYMLNSEKVFRDVGFRNTSYLGTILYTLSKVYSGNDIEGYAHRAMEINKEIKSGFSFLHEGDSYSMSILLAQEGGKPHEVKEYYDEFTKRGYKKGTGLQTLSCTMTFTERNVEEDIDRCEKIYKYLESHKFRITSEHYTAIGLISLIEGDLDEVLEDIVEIIKLLKEDSNYKWLDKGMNLLIAVGIISSEHINEDEKNLIIDTILSDVIQANFYTEMFVIAVALLIPALSLII